ncbi:unnamed protein product, partial [Mesorhabditis spiculigera]
MTAPWRIYTTGDLLRNIYFVYEQKRRELRWQAGEGRDEGKKKLFRLSACLTAVFLAVKMIYGDEDCFTDAHRGEKRTRSWILQVVLSVKRRRDSRRKEDADAPINTIQRTSTVNGL